MAKKKKEKPAVPMVSGARAKSEPLAWRVSDPYGIFLSYLNRLPKVDEVLRKLGKDQEVYRELYTDAHVMGELRSVRSGLLGYDWRIEPPEDGSPAAFELVKKLFKQKPYKNGHWPDVIWTIATAVWAGLSTHELRWKREGEYVVPFEVIDRPARRFVFGSVDNELRLLTRRAPFNGEEIPDRRILLTRHMPSYENPYGEAVFSACIWPHFFKKGGFRYFVTFCERYGLPWAVGKHNAANATQEERDILLDGLLQMVEGGVGAIPDDDSVQVFSFNSGGQSLPQERLVQLCNREISKALTSQTLSTEIPSGGSRAAAETHHERELEVHLSDRDMVSATFNTYLEWVTAVNFGEEVPAPTFKFIEETKPKMEEVEFLEKATKIIDVPKSEAYARLAIREPVEGEDIIERRAMPPEMDDEMRQNTGQNAREFARKEQNQADISAVIEGLGQEKIDDLSKSVIQRVLARAETDPEGLRNDAKIVTDLTSEELTDTLARAMFVLRLVGEAEVEEGEE